MGLRIPLASLIFFALSVAYLGGEFAFNAMMLDVAGNISATPDAIEKAKDFGRFVSASGFTLLTLGLFSRSEFLLRNAREWALMAAVFVFCMMPSFVVMGGDAQIPVDGESFMTFLPLLGLLVAVLSGGHYRVYVIIAVILMAWPSMYAGQKIFIEHYAVDKTGWQERADARNVLMLRASLEDCTVDLGDHWLCTNGPSGADLRAVRAIITALWMHNPSKVLADLGARKETIIEDVAFKGAWFSPRKMYDAYVRKVTSEYNRYQTEMTQKYYVPYKRASDLYLASTDPAALQKQADDASDEVEKEIDAGWNEYKDGVRRYKSAINTAQMEALGSAGGIARFADRLCDGRTDCPSQPDPSRAIERAHKKARSAFIKQSGGYPPDIRSREEFMAFPQTEEKIRAAVESKIIAKTGDDNFKLPADWIYDRVAFKDMIKGIVREKASTLWEKNFRGRFKPGLDRDAFFKAGSKDEIPQLGDIIMTEDQFIKTQVMPANRDFVDQALNEMKAEAPLYQNGQTLQEKGKNFVRAAYIPAVALVLSLMIVMLTLSRGISAGLSYLERKGKFFPDTISPSSIRMGVMATILLLLLVVPYAVTNPQTSAPTYKKYLGFAREKNIITASVLDWAVHMQPLIYGTGGAIRSLGGSK